MIRSAVIIAALAVGFVSGGCASHYQGKLPGAPADATFVEVDGVHVRYREMGDGPAVVLIHGYGASSDHWLNVMPALATHFRVIAVDLEGFGWTDRPEGDYSPAAEAALVWKVLDKLGVGDTAIVGHSWGTSVALSMAVQAPQRTRRVALYSAYVYDEEVPSFFRWAEKPGIGEALFTLFYKERFEDRGPLAYYDERWVTQARIDHIEDELDRPGTSAAALAVAQTHHFAALHEKLRTFTKPVLLLWGENDEVTPISFGERLQNELVHAQLIRYPRCGHLPMVEAHAPSTRDLATFLAHDLAPTAPAPVVAAADGAEPAPAPFVAPDMLDKATEDAIMKTQPVAPPPRTMDLPIGADLAALGAELAPRAYAAPREHGGFTIHGSLRFREQSIYNGDLDRGLDSTGKPLYPVPLSGGQRIDTSDMRARTDLAFYAPGVGVAVKARIDWLDNVALGGSPDLSNGSPATSPGQRPTTAVVKRAWGEVLTPFGILAAGRMGAHFGLGIAANGGDCDDCDKGDAADRIAFVSPLFGHLFAIAYDIAARGPFTQSNNGGHAIALETTDAAAGITFAVLKTHSPATLARRAEAGLTTVEYGAYVATRSQDKDVPATYLPTAAPVTTFTSADLVGRGFSALNVGGWVRITRDGMRFEAEGVHARADIDNPSLIPGTVIDQKVTSRQYGFAAQSDVTLGPSRIGFDFGYASGDSAPGFGAYPTIGQTATTPGSFDGPQADLPRDHTVDNFRFHPDFHIDQILFREIIGTITDAVYLRPHVAATLMQVGKGHLEASAAFIASWAVEATSTPSGQASLGYEIDPELRYVHRDGFAAAITPAVFLPGPAFDNTTLEAKPAYAVRARLWFQF
ncbi:MAG TPA: alpha/beta fold hydrolase [Kofleriaceae bacterium]